MNRDHEPLTPEERELARRLARVASPAEPSAALDARILAAARTTGDGFESVTFRDKPARPRSRYRWTAGFGLAASVLLAVGIAWQLRPLPDADVQYSEAPSAARVEEPPAEWRARDAFPGRPPEAAAPPRQLRRQAQPSVAPAPADETIREERKQSAPPRDAAAADADDREAEAAVVFDDPSPVDTPAPAPPPPPAPQAAAAAAPEPDLSTLPAAGAASAAPQESANERERKAGAEDAGRDAAMQRRAESLDRIEVTGSRVRQDEIDGFADQPYDDEPPASADSPEVRKAWLSRIRELLDEGKVDAARASLAEFHRRYPDAALPDDLRPLLE